MLFDTTEYMERTARNIFGERFDEEIWAQTMRHAFSFNTSGSAAVARPSKYSPMILQVVSSFASTWGIDGASPAVQYLTMRTFIEAGKRKSDTNSDMPVTVYQLTE